MSRSRLPGVRVRFVGNSSSSSCGSIRVNDWGQRRRRQCQRCRRSLQRRAVPMPASPSLAISVPAALPLTSSVPHAPARRTCPAIFPACAATVTQQKPLLPIDAPVHRYVATEAGRTSSAGTVSAGRCCIRPADEGATADGLTGVTRPCA